MKWVKDALLDIIILGVIVAYTITLNNVLEIILWVYTGFLLIGKILYFYVGFLQSKATKTQVPDWFNHAVYLISIVLLLLSMNYYLALAWGVIWVLSIIPLLNKGKKSSK